MKRPRLFPGIIFALLGMNVVIVGVTVYAANKDGGAVIEPDYYRKALAYDTLAAQQRDADALGWQYDTDLVAADDTTALRMQLQDDTQSAVTGAVVRAVAFASARADQRTHLLLRESSSGTYEASFEPDRAGLWRIELTIESRGRVISHKSDLMVGTTP